MIRQIERARFRMGAFLYNEADEQPFASATCESAYAVLREMLGDLFVEPPGGIRPYAYTSFLRGSSDVSYLGVYCVHYDPDACTDYQAWHIASALFYLMTRRLTGLVRVHWVNTMLCGTVGLEVMRRIGYGIDADELSGRCYGTPTNAVDLTAVKPRSRFRCFWSPAEHCYFIAKATCIGLKLEELVGWDQLLHILISSTWDEWLQEVPRGNRGTCREVINLAAQGPG